MTLKALNWGGVTKGVSVHRRKIQELDYVLRHPALRDGVDEEKSSA